MCCSTSVISCSGNDLKSDVNSFLKEKSYSNLFYIIKYDKYPSKKLINVRLKSILKNELFKLDSIKNDNSFIYSIHPSESIKDLVFKESTNSYSIIGQSLVFESVDSLVYKEGYSHFLAYTRYSIKSVSKIYELDDLAFDSKEFSQQPQVILKFKKTLFGLNLVSIESSNIYHSSE